MYLGVGGKAPRSQRLTLLTISLGLARFELPHAHTPFDLCLGRACRARRPHFVRCLRRSRLPDAHTPYELRRAGLLGAPRSQPFQLYRGTPWRAPTN